MAESDRQRLFLRAQGLRTATASDFQGGRRAPHGVSTELVKVIDDKVLRTKLIAVRLAEGLQSPKGPQKIASIVRIYPNFDAPPRVVNGRVSSGRRPGRPPGRPAGSLNGMRSLPSVEEMERLIERIREVEGKVATNLSAQTDAQIERLKRSLADLHGAQLEAAFVELGQALEKKRALTAQVRSEAFSQIESDSEFAPKSFLRLLAR